MRYLPAFAALLAVAPCVLAKSKAKINTSSSPVHHLARSPRAVVAARQGSSSTSGGEFCGTDDFGEDWYCDDPSTFCCTGPEIWQCAPMEAEECCSTGYYCDAGTHCYLDSDGEQECLTPEEAEAVAGDEIDPTSGSGSGSSGSGSDSTSADDDGGDDTTTSSGSDDGGSEEEDEDGSDGFAAGASSGGKKKKGGSGSDSGVGRVSAGSMMVGVVAIGVLALV